MPRILKDWKLEIGNWKFKKKISNLKSQISNPKGFTLIELLVAISIVAILSTIGIVLFTNALETSRDTTRKNALKQIQTALELYYEDTGKYPIPQSGDCVEVTKESLGEEQGEDAKFYEYLKEVPQDPKGATIYSYCYESATKTYALSAVLENCEAANAQDCKYELVADDSFIAQAPQSVTPDQVHFRAATVFPSPSPSAFVRPVGIVLPPSCNGFSVTPYYNVSWINPASEIKIKPFVTDWSKVSKVMVYTYKDPIRSINQPYEEGKWDYAGEVTNSAATVMGYAGTEGYAGRYVVKMDVYDKPPTTTPPTPARKVAGLGTVLEGKCLQDFTVQDNPSAICEDDNTVQPRNLIAYQIPDGNKINVLLKWQITNYQGSSGDQFTAYRSNQAGFTVDSSKRTMSSLIPGSGYIHDNTPVGSGSHFYKVAAFNEGGETVSSDQAGVSTPRHTASCTEGTIFGPPGASNLRNPYGATLNWEYQPMFTNGLGWNLIGDNGYKFQIPTNAVTVSWCGWYCMHLYYGAWTMSYVIPGNYYIQSYGTCSYRGAPSNPVAMTGTANTEVPPPDVAPTNVQVSIPYHKSYQSISWADNSSNEKGFNVYKDPEPLDLSKSTQTSDTNSFLREAYFENVPPGKHYFAAKDSNPCGEGWSNYIEVNIP